MLDSPSRSLWQGGKHHASAAPSSDWGDRHRWSFHQVAEKIVLVCRTAANAARAADGDRLIRFLLGCISPRLCALGVFHFGAQNFDRSRYCGRIRPPARSPPTKMTLGDIGCATRQRFEPFQLLSKHSFER